MKKFKLGIVVLLMAAFTGIANAGGVGYIDYAKVIDNYDYAKQVTKEVDAKGLEMQQFLVDKETAYVTLKNKREQEVFTKIKDAAKAVMVEQKLDAVMDVRGIFVGGVDITDSVIAKLKASK